MLVLTRSEGQAVLIGDNIVVTVVAMANGQVKLGFDAPKDVAILREELVDHGALPVAGPEFD